MKVKHNFNDILLKERKSVGWFLLCYYLDGYRQNNQKSVKNLSLFFFFFFIHILDIQTKINFIKYQIIIFKINMSAQDVLGCDTCEVTIIHSYCDTCRTNICKTCVVNHIADEHHKHVIVSFEERRSTFIYPKCGKHNKNCEFECKTCEHMVCSSCRASVQHAGRVCGSSRKL